MYGNGITYGLAECAKIEEVCKLIRKEHPAIARVYYQKCYYYRKQVKEIREIL